MPIIARVASSFHRPPRSRTSPSRAASQRSSESTSTPSRSNTTATTSTPATLPRRARPRPPRAGRHLPRRRGRRARPRRPRRGLPERARRLAVGDLRRQRHRRRAARLPRHPPAGAPAALGLPPPAAGHGLLRRADHLLDDAGRAAAHAHRPGDRLREREPRRRARRRVRRDPPGAMVWVAVALLGGAGALGRFLLDAAVSERVGRELPVGTLAVNVSGAFALGLLGPGHLLAGTALMGSYTTFSTWMLESHRLGEDGRTKALLANLVVSLAAGLAAAALGRAL